MKILLILSTILFINAHLEISLFRITAILISLSLNRFSNFNNWKILWDLNFDIFTFWFLFILFYSIILTLLASSSRKIKSFQIFKVLNIIIFLIILIFICQNILIFYIMFELSVIPIFLIIIGWGYQPERQSATFAIFFYTAFCSAPFLIIILTLLSKSGTYNWIIFSRLLLVTKIRNSAVIVFTIFIAFIVKIPIIGLHMWLPKAHVEAPVNGSMVLAAVLLKLAGLGILRILQINSRNPLNLFIVIRIIGIVYIGLLCVRLFDIKIIIAYSSVAHIALALICALQGTKIAALRALLIIISHAFASSFLFFGITKIYENSNRRRVVINRGVLIIFPKFSLLWLMAVIARIGTPPFLRFYAELTCFYIIFNSFTQSWLLVIITIFLAGVYSLVLYGASQHRKIKKFIVSNYSVYRSDYFISIIHVTIFFSPLFLLSIFFI